MSEITFPQRLETVCYTMRGFGNVLIDSLSKYDFIDIVCVYSRKMEHSNFYYPCETLESICDRMQIPLKYISDKGEWENQGAPLGIISSYHRILRSNHLNKHNVCINLHPSLLPSYRGATPTNWMIRNGESIVGLTAHLVTESVDEGPVIYQRKLLNPQLTDAQLRKSLAFFSSDAIDFVVDNYPNYATLQKNHELASWQSIRDRKDAVMRVDNSTPVVAIINHIKAFTNYPMPVIVINNRHFVVDYDSPRDTVDVETRDGEISLLGYWSHNATTRS